MNAPVSSIVIVGLGPGDPESRTVGTQRALDRADRVVLRTRIHPGLDDLLADPRVTDCDDLYERADSFEPLYQQIAERVIAVAREEIEVVFAVPGHPRFGERSVELISAKARTHEIPVTVLDAVSFIDAAATVLRIDPLAEGLQLADGEHLASTLDADPFAAGALGVDPARPLLIGQVYNRDLAASVKITLARLYPEDHPVIVVRSAGVASESEVVATPLHALDRCSVDHLTSVWVGPLAPLEAYRSPEALTRIVARLRRPDGCPWDRKQSHASLRESVLEEAYEVVDAIDSDDASGLSEELGDLLLLIAMLAQIAEEDGSFRIEDVLEGISRKLIRRHPHVFGDVIADSPDAVMNTWEGVKAAERAAKGNPPPSDDPVDRLPRAMPITRKIIETLAPRATLRGPDRPDAGAAALASIAALIEDGVDPERALEAALRTLVGQEHAAEEAFSAIAARNEREESRA